MYRIICVKGNVSDISEGLSTEMPDNINSITVFLEVYKDIT